ncbi:MAG: S1/P1 Nuclease [Robiginitomaculum sp.]|nr:MAG: S1/P1 Nuclease [Robiginitomaculum sp.]
MAKRSQSGCFVLGWGLLGWATFICQGGTSVSRFFAAVLLVIFSTSPAFAWGPTGHRVVGEIADSHLSDQARLQVQAILGTEDLAEAGPWPDFMRASPDPFWRKEAGVFHYVTVPVGVTYGTTSAPPEGDAYTALQRFAKTLRDPAASREDKALALRFTAHLVGDLHQPLHVGNGKDRGGNRFDVVFFEEMTNLHFVWDELIINRERLSFSEKAAWLDRKMTPEQVMNWSKTDPLVWIAESAELRETIYPEQQILSWQYIYDHQAELDQRLSQAGIRLAAYLNELFEK